VRNIGRGKPSVSLTLGRKEEMKPETIPSPLLISESTATGVALMISESALTRFSSTISVSVANQFLLPNYGVSSKLVFATELWCQFSLQNYNVSSESIFTDDSVFQQISLLTNLRHQRTSFADNSAF